MKTDITLILSLVTLAIAIGVFGIADKRAHGALEHLSKEANTTIRK